MRPTWLFLAASLALAQSAAAVTDDDRTQVYREFRGLFDTREYAQARPLAERLVALTEEQYGGDAAALTNPLSNLATTAYRLKDYPAAEENYLRAMKILEATGGNADRQLLRPLHGLGATYLALNQYEDAIPPLKRAVDLSRNLDGLFNIDQLEFLEPLIASYAALGRMAETEKEQQYALHVAETAYGNSDMRMLEPLDRYARWLEEVERYASARGLHVRALTIAELRGGKGSTRRVLPLQGIARTYRLEFLNGTSEPSESDDLSRTGLRTEASNSQRLNPDGEQALKAAMATIEKASPVDHQLRGSTLLELGDWYLAGRTAGAQDLYREAWKDLAQIKATAPLEAPRLLAYRPTSASLKRSRLDPQTAELRFVESSFTVTREGRTTDIKIVSSDAPEVLQKAVSSAVKRARYRPRLENGEPVDTPGVTLRELLLLRKPRPEGRFDRG